MKLLHVAAMSIAMLVCASAALADPTPAPAPGQNHMSVDPCALMTANDATSVVGAVNPTPQRPSQNECLWSAASVTHSTQPVSQVLFTLDVAQEARHGCKGLGCLSVVQSVTGMIPGLSSFNNTMSAIGGTATTIQGLGQRAAWANGILAVLQNQTIFKIKLSGTQSDMLDASKSLAEKVLSNMQSNAATPQP